MSLDTPGVSSKVFISRATFNTSSGKYVAPRMASNCAAKAGGGVCLCQQQYRNLNIYKDNKRGDARRGDEKG